MAGATGDAGVGRASVEPSVEASVAPSAPARLAIVFNEANSSKVFGGGVLNDLGDGTTAVTLGVVAIGFTDPMPANLEAGACADLATAAPSGAPGCERLTGRVGRGERCRVRPGRERSRFGSGRKPDGDAGSR